MKVRCKKCRAEIGERALKEHKDTCTIITSEEQIKGTDIEKAAEGRVHCSSCRTVLGRFKWYGTKCACGEWIFPYIGIHKNSVDIER